MKLNVKIVVSCDHHRDDVGASTWAQTDSSATSRLPHSEHAVRRGGIRHRSEFRLPIRTQPDHRRTQDIQGDRAGQRRRRQILPCQQVWYIHSITDWHDVWQVSYTQVLSSCFRSQLQGNYRSRLWSRTVRYSRRAIQLANVGISCQPGRFFWREP